MIAINDLMTGIMNYAADDAINAVPATLTPHGFDNTFDQAADHSATSSHLLCFIRTLRQARSSSFTNPPSINISYTLSYHPSQPGIMADQVKYSNKLQGKNVLVIGGSSGILPLRLLVFTPPPSNNSNPQASATASPKPASNSAQPSPSPLPTQTASPPPSPNCKPPTHQPAPASPATPATSTTKQPSKATSPLSSTKPPPTPPTSLTTLFSQQVTPSLL